MIAVSQRVVVGLWKKSHVTLKEHALPGEPAAIQVASLWRMILSFGKVGRTQLPES